jgi:hypothetical protein
MKRHPRKCTAHTKSTGKPCEKWAIKGGTVCARHGGAISHVRAKANERLALAEAQRMVERAGVDVDPTEHLLDSLHQAAQLASVWGLMVAALDAASEEEAAEHGTLRGELGYRAAEDEDDGQLRVVSNDRLLALNRAGMAQLHPFMIEYQRAIERRAHLAKLCIDARVGKKRVELEQQRGELIASLFRSVFSDPALGLERSQRQRAMVTAAKHLRLVAGSA